MLESILTPEILEGYKAKTLPKELQDAIQSLYDNYAIVKSATAKEEETDDDYEGPASVDEYEEGISEDEIQSKLYRPDIDALIIEKLKRE